MQILEAINKKSPHPRVHHGLDHYRKKLARAWGMATQPLKSGPAKIVVAGDFSNTKVMYWIHTHRTIYP
jgi:hypothetical protein